MLDRRLFTSMTYPADYGFIEGTLGEDGDPLDALCLVGEPTFPGCRIRVRVVGVFYMTDEKGPDEKIICVPLKDTAFMRVHDVHDIAPEFRDEIEHFFQVYRTWRKEDGDARIRQPCRGRADHRRGEGASRGLTVPGTGPSTRCRPTAWTPRPPSLPARQAARVTGCRQRLLLAVFVGGAAGGLGRAALERAIPASGHGWPWATFVANVVGTALARVLRDSPAGAPAAVDLSAAVPRDGPLRRVTTFSTLQLETIDLVRNGHVTLGVSYLATSIVAGLAVVHVITALVRRETLR